MIRTATLTLVFLFSSTFLYSGTFTAIASGNWSNGAIWSSSGGGNPTPGKNDDVYIPGGFTVTVNSLQEAKTVTLQGNNSSLVLNATLKVVKAVGGTDAVIFDGTSLTAGNTQIIRINSGGLLDMRASATKQENILFSASPLGIQKIVLASNTSPSDGINCADLTMGNSNTLIEYETGGQATIFIGDDLTGGSLVPGSGTVEFHGSLTGGPTQEIRGQYTFYNLGFRSQQPKYLGMANASTPSSQYSFTVQNNLYLSRSTGNQGTPPVLYLESAVLNVNGNLVLNDSSRIVIDGSGSFAPDSAGLMIEGDLILKDVNQNASSSSNLTIQNYSSSIQDLIVVDGELTMDGSITSNQKHGWYLRGKSTLRGNWPQSAINALMANMRGDDTVRISGLIFIDGTLTLDGGTLELAATGPGNDLHLDALSLLNGSGVILNSNDLIIKGTFPSSTDGLRVEDAGSFIDGSGGGWLEFSSSADQDIRIQSAANDFRVDNLKASGGSGNLTIQIGSGLDSLSAYGKVLIETGKNLNTNGGLILRSTSSSEYAQAFRAGTGTITGDFRLERTIASTTTAGWRNMAIPVTGGSIGTIRGVKTFVTNDSSQYHIYTWDASQNGSTGLANGWSVVLDPATANDGTKGYILYMGPPFFNLRKNPIDITGGFRTGSQVHTLYKYFDPQGPTQSNTIEQGWNFLPNPYSANLSIPAIISAVPTYKAVHIYDPSSGQYAAYTSSTAINYNTGSTNAPAGWSVGPMGGFWVKLEPADPVSQSFSITESMVDMDQSGISQLRTQALNQLEVIVSSPNGFSDKTMVVFHSGTTRGMDQGWDAYKRKSPLSTHPSLFSVDGNLEFSINTLPEVVQQSLPLGFESEITGNFTLQVDLDNFDPHTHIILEDQLTGNFHDLRTGGYSFQHNQPGTSSRFILHFSGYPMDLKEWEKNFSLGVLVNSGSRVIYIPNENSGPVNLRGFDALGRLIFEMRTDHQVDLSQYDSPGIEILHVTGSGRSVRMKF